MNGSAAVAEILRREGVEYVFCFPANPLIDAAAAAGIRPIVGRLERTVINMADGYTRVTNGRRTGVCMVQRGPGIENAYGGIAQAYADRTPLLVLPGGEPRARVGLPTAYDAADNYRGVTKWAARFASAAQIPAQLRRAFTYLRAGRPGPVLLEMPADVATEEAGDAPRDYAPVPRLRTAADPEAVTRAVRLLLAAERPLLHVGQGVLWAEATAELREFAELVQAPVMTTLLGKSAFPEDHPLAIGCGGASASYGVREFLPRADLVFSIGASLSRTLASCPIPGGKPLVQCVVDERDVNAEYALAAAVLGDAKLVLQQLCEEVRRQTGPEGRRDDARAARAVAAMRERLQAEWLPRLTSDEAPINPYRVIWEVMQAIDRAQAIVTHDSGNVRDQVAPFYVAAGPRSYLGWGNSTQLGTSLGLALGAKLAAPDKLVAHFLGDAAFGMCGLDLETAVRHRIPILTLLLNNSAMGNYEKMQPVAVERFGIKRLSGDYAGVARALGVWAERVETPDEIAPALRRAVAVVQEGRPALLEFITREEPAILAPPRD
ncbi:MAG TPA: thiamine pyrophosphate-requiring protein [Chloroflexota bacterium]|jgi:thiamine pyrophosphate-dependent acetolactate synthase large subunit-like protein|nr:thiamine pyrophosphate-requiring protein [Chloroflexota bacterium]